MGTNKWKNSMPTFAPYPTQQALMSACLAASLVTCNFLGLSQFPASFMDFDHVIEQRKVPDTLLNLEVEGRQQNAAQGSCRRILWSRQQCTLDIVVIRNHIKSRRNLPAVGCRYLLHGCKCEPQAASNSFIEELQYLLINVHLPTNSSWSLAIGLGKVR